MLYFFLSASDNSLYSSKIDSQGINSENNSEALSYTFVVFFFFRLFEILAYQIYLNHHKSWPENNVLIIKKDYQIF